MRGGRLSCLRFFEPATQDTRRALNPSSSGSRQSLLDDSLIEGPQATWMKSPRASAQINPAVPEHPGGGQEGHQPLEPALFQMASRIILLTRRFSIGPDFEHNVNTFSGIFSSFVWLGVIQRVCNDRPCMCGTRPPAIEVSAGREVRSRAALRPAEPSPKFPLRQPS